MEGRRKANESPYCKPFQNPRLTSTRPGRNAQSSNRPRSLLPKTAQALQPTQPTHACSRAHRREPAWSTCRPISRLGGRSGGRSEGKRGHHTLPRAGFDVWKRSARRVCSCGPGGAGYVPSSLCVALRGVSMLYTIICIPDRSRAAGGRRYAVCCMQCRQGCRAKITYEILAERGTFVRSTRGNCCHLHVRRWVSTFLEFDFDA